MKTKSLVRFLNRAAHFDADIELVDVMNRAKDANALHSDKSEFIFTHVDANRHPRLAKRQKNDHNRTLAFSHLKATMCAAFIKDIFEDLTTYFREVLAAAASNGLDPKRLIGEHRIKFDANEVLAVGGWDAVVRLVSDAVFRRLENLQDTKSLIQKINDKLALGVDAAKIDDALPYLELRHLLVHNDGLADQEFCNRFPDLGSKPNEKIALDYRTLSQARQAIVALVKEYDERIVAGDVVSKTELQP